MKIQKLRMIAPALALAMLANIPAVATAQDATQQQQGKAQTKERDVIIERNEVIVTGPGAEGHMPPPAEIMSVGKPGSGDNFVFVSSEMSFGGKTVKGAPYSAQSVTETVQTLADGNRIVRKNTASVYRDGEGRTRRDQTLGAIGPFGVQGDPPQTFFINDPVAGINYILDPRSRIARKLAQPRWELEQKSGGVRAIVTTQAPKDSRGVSLSKVPMDEYVASSGSPGANVVTVRRSGSQSFIYDNPAPGAIGEAPQVFHYSNDAADAKTESLGKQTVEGVEAEGKRTTTTIPAGKIGNEQPIQIVSERWYSPELQTVVMTRRSDPRFGETTFRLTNINRGEPARSLFEVPADYTVKEGPAAATTVMRRMKKPSDK